MQNLKLPKQVAKRKRVGRGIAAGGGKTAGRGTKGQGSRTGSSIHLPKHFLKLPKLRGFKSSRVKRATISYERVTKQFADGAKVSYDSLVKLGMVRRGVGVKIVGPKTDKKKFQFMGVKTTKTITGA